MDFEKIENTIKAVPQSLYVTIADNITNSSIAKIITNITTTTIIILHYYIIINSIVII